MSAGHRSQSWWNRFRSSMLNVPLRDNNGRNIEVVRWPKLVDETGVMHFEDSDPRDSLLKHVKPDVVVMATGYSTNFSFLDNDYPTLSHANVRGIYKDDDVSVGFVGFVRPSIGKLIVLPSQRPTTNWLFCNRRHSPTGRTSSPTLGSSFTSAFLPPKNSHWTRKRRPDFLRDGLQAPSTRRIRHVHRQTRCGS